MEGKGRLERESAVKGWLGKGKGKGEEVPFSPGQGWTANRLGLKIWGPIPHHRWLGRLIFRAGLFLPAPREKGKFSNSASV